MINLLMGTRFPVLIKMLLRNGFSIHPKYLFRLLIVVYNSLISSALTLVEKMKYSGKIRKTVIEKPPLFIIGHWRTGSTYLHQLLNLDLQFTSLNLVQTVIPDHLLFSSKYYGPIMSRMTPDTRPMDNVKLSPFEPQEDEFALLRMGSASPLEKFFFPVKDRYFLDGYEEYIPEGRRLEVWKRNLLTLYKKITFLTGKQIVSKNPSHTMRMSLLTEMFPGARFIHIYRHPYSVVPSTIHMWNVVSEQNKLRRSWKNPEPGEVASVMYEYLRHVSRESKKLGKHQFTEVLFPNLEQNPLAELKRIYAALNLEFKDEFEQEVVRFIESNKDFKKNTYSLTEKDKEIIRKDPAFSQFRFDTIPE